VLRTGALLPAVTGNFGKPGAGFLDLNWNFNAPVRYLDEAYLTAPHLAASPPPRLRHMDVAACLADPGRAQALMAWNINIAASNPAQARLRQALRREDLFTVALDLCSTETTDCADVVLPAASFLECNDRVAGDVHLSLSAPVKAMAPWGEALPTQESFRRLARAMRYTEPELSERDADILATVRRQANLGVDLPALAATGAVPVSPEPLLQFADLTFPTPRGRIELASAHAAADGYPRVPRPLADPRPPSGRLRLLSPASP
jgi:anaerobic selenocysteine-containing dehydrogenase